MPGQPHVINGKVYDKDGSTVLSDIVVFVLDKNLKEIHSSNDAGFEDLKTDADGEYSTNLANFTSDYSDGDKIYVMARDGDNTAIGSTTVTQSAGLNTVNLTMKTFEPFMNVLWELRAWVDDINSTRDDADLMIMPTYPRDLKIDEENYPRVSVESVNEEEEEAGNTSNQTAEIMSNINIGIFVHDKGEGSSQIFSVTKDSATDNYSGKRALELLVRDILDRLRQRFLLKPAYKKDALINPYYDYSRVSSETEPFDEELGVWIHNIKIEFKFIKQEE